MICDIAKKEKLKKKLRFNYDYVVNLGGYVDHTNKEKTYKSHYIGCKNLSEIFLQKKITSFIQIGSSAEYGKNKSPQKETQVCKPSSIYGSSKLRATKYLVNLNFKKKISMYRFTPLSGVWSFSGLQSIYSNNNKIMF